MTRRTDSPPGEVLEQPAGHDGHLVGQRRHDSKLLRETAPSQPVEVVSAAAATVMVMCITVLITGLLGFALWSAERGYGSGIELVIHAKSYEPTSAARRIFLLAGGMQITMFKVIAFGISTLLALVGGVFILNGSKAAYQLNLSKGDASGALVSTSPGLVIMTLAMGLAAFTLHSKSDISDHTDLDVRQGVVANPDADSVGVDEAKYIKQAQAALSAETSAPQSTSAAASGLRGPGTQDNSDQVSSPVERAHAEGKFKDGKDK